MAKNQNSALAPKKSGGKKGLPVDKIIAIALAVVCLLAIIYLVVSVAGSRYTYPTLLIDGEKISENKYSFYYNMQYINATNGSPASLGIDPNVSLAKQKYNADMTWADYFEQLATGSIYEVYILNAEAEKNNFPYNEEDTKAADEQIASIEATCEEYGYSFDYYVKAMYKKNISKDELHSYLKELNRYERYYTQLTDAYEVTEDEINKQYNDNKKDYTFADYRYFGFNGSLSTKYDDNGNVIEASEEEKKAALAEAEEKAKKFVQSITDAESFIKLAKENASEDLKEKYEDPDYTLVKGVTSSDVYADLSTWMFDESRKAGDKFYINIGNYYYAIYLESDLYRDESYATSAQIIALPTSDTLKEEDAKKDLQAKIDEWAKGTKDEDSFIAIRTSNSDKLSGGLYMISEVQTNDLPEDILSWMFDDSRKEGDYTVISDSEGAYAIYWVEVAENPVWYETASSAIKYEKYKTEIEALKANYPLVEK